jgi:UDP-N-acetylmuramate dehydrogenase
MRTLEPVQEQFDVPIAPLTTLRVGGSARRLLTVADEAELVAAVLDADHRAEPLLIIGGGSNLVVGDDGFDGTVLRIASTGISRAQTCVGLRYTVAAGHDWDDFVAATVADGVAGVECLSGIPGSAGGTPIQNVGAYGQEVSDTIAWVRVLDRRSGQVSDKLRGCCEFGYRDSVFKGDERYVVLSVTFHFAAPTPTRWSAPIRYAELARRLGVEPGEPAGLDQVRATVLELRRAKGMVLDAADQDTWSAGSFFTNPVLPGMAFAALERRVAARLGNGSRPPRFPSPQDGRIKTSAAWLIEQAGFGRGYGQGPARVSGKHTLAITNRGGAKAEDVLALAREIRDGVRDAFGVELVPEPVLVGTSF